MPAATLTDLRKAIRAHTLADETALAERLIALADIGADRRKRAQDDASAFVSTARAAAGRSSLIDQFLQEYGLSTTEGVTLMRLAEALLRTPDAATADALIKDKVEAGDWATHAGKSRFPLVNFSTRALMLTAAWLDDVEAKDPARRLVKSTKALLDRVGDPVIRGAVAQAMKIMGEHFVLGETIDEAFQRGRRFADAGYTFSFDMLGEAALTAGDAARFFDDYAAAIAAIAASAAGAAPADNPGISVKLSALHPRYEYAQKERVRRELGARTKALALAAKNARIGFNIDAEEADRLDLSLDLIEMLARDPDLGDWDGFGVVVQAYQRRATYVIEWLAGLARETGRRLMIRLVKGAYWDAEIKRAQVLGLESYPVFTRKALTDVSFTACARLLIDNADVFYPQFATHNALTAAMVREMAGDLDAYELQRLHGMGESLHDSLIAAGARSRIYAPVGGHKELLPYLVRRLLENGANSSFVNQLIDPELSIDAIVADPIDAVRAAPSASNQLVGAPKDLFNGERLSAAGFDLTEPDVAARLEAFVREPIDERAAAILARDGDQAGAARAVRNPATGDVVGAVIDADEAAVDAAGEAATAAAPSWAATPARDRGDILRRAGDLLETRTDDFMRLAVQEAGKTHADALAEVREAVDFLRYYANEAERLPLDAAPLGVVACVSPWNFPLAIFLGQVSAALAAGNAVVAKPAEQTPLIAAAATRLLHEAGVPRAALQLTPGDGPSVGAPLVRHPSVDGVVFTGSTATAKAINRALIDAGKHAAPLIAETGGINAMIIDSTALMEQAVMDVVASAFQSAGQRCSAARVVCVQRDVADRFCEMLAGAVAELAVGDPRTLSTDVGPVIDEEARNGIDARIAELRQSARVVAEAAPAPASAGLFVRPIAFEVANLKDVREEIFGPVLQIARFDADELAGLVEDLNALGYGLTLGVHTRIDETMHDIVSRARIGNIYVNRNQIGAVVGVQPFGGEGLSGTGPKAGGPHYLPALVARKAAPHTSEAGDAPRLQIVDEGASLLGQRVAAAQHAFNAWSRFEDRRAVLMRAAAHADRAGGAAAARVLRQAVTLARALDAPTELPGPTGESNTLRLRGRGLILCLGRTKDAIEAQLANALGAGDAVICDQSAGDGLADRLADALAAAGAPADLVASLPNLAQPPRSLLTDARLRAVAFDGAEADHAVLAEALAAREGPIAPILSGEDPAARYAVERTLTINTTAAGGDVRLLSTTE